LSSNAGYAFIQILILCPNLQMIRVQSLPSMQEMFSNNEMLNLVKNKKIKKLSLVNPGTADQIDFIIHLFRHIESFEIQIKSNNNLELIFVYIFENIKKNNMGNIKKCCLIT